MASRPPIHIGNVVRNARAFNAQHWRGSPFTMDELLLAVDTLFEILDQRKITYVLVGGVALLHYVQGRNTEDIDLILNIAALKQLPEITLVSQDRFFARGQFRDLQIDFLLTENPLFAYVRRDYTTQQAFFERTITCATIEGLILLKLYALPSLYRQGDFARVGLYENDIATLMYYHQPDMPPLVQNLAAYINAEDLAEIQGIVADLDQRIARFRRSPSDS